MSALLFENRRTIRSFRSLMIFAVISFAYGILMEILQSFTVSRSGNFADAMADFAGIVFSILLWQLFKPIIYRSDNY
jgi:VanZ family protein